MELPVHQHFHQSVTVDGICFILSSFLNMSSIIDFILQLLILLKYNTYNLLYIYIKYLLL